ncbi:F0F1 ATP synthase subunit alpha [Candidatus Nomurabacteria bacterium]|nr:F0F1 ATP synthase subunit alpha [Candidatus Nomurabacteria bacterium]
MSNINVKDLTKELEAAISGISQSGDYESAGVVTRVGDGIVWVYGLQGCGYSDVIEIEVDGGTPARAFALNLNEDEIGAVLLDSEIGVRAGAKAVLTGRPLEVPVGPELLGRVVDPLGRPLDGLGPIKAKQTGLIEKNAPGVMDRKSVHEPLATGVMAIDTMVPIGRGQRELIIGDRQTGKTAIAVDTMINQAKQKTGVINVFVAIGQKRAKVAALVDRLKTEGVMDQTIIVSSSPSDPASLLYLAPYAGTAIGEYFRDNKQHALIIFDDLSKHAVAYRQMSLLLKRPPGREAYPGDVFYLHSRLLERAAKLSDALGAGSLTALPIIETQAGDVSAYIPTNVISITDGQIYLETNLFNQGVRPAISVGLSVSRVGGSAQTKATKSVAGALRVELAQFRELASFAQFASDLDEDTKKRIARGRLLTEVLKQKQYQPLSVAEQVIILLGATSGHFDTLLEKDVQSAAHQLVADIKKSHKSIYDSLNEGNKPDEKSVKVIEAQADKIAKTFGEGK